MSIRTCPLTPRPDPWGEPPKAVHRKPAQISPTAGSVSARRGEAREHVAFLTAATRLLHPCGRVAARAYPARWAALPQPHPLA